ncbi:unnamed protein product [Lathyrus sativus]|nr:unnamed protein product [Lathyrus sativus]
MGCFSCFDSKEDEKLNPHPEQETHNHDHHNHNHNLLSAASGGAEKLRSTSNGGASKREFSALLKDGPPGQIAAQTFTFRELALATKNFRPQSFLGEGGFGRVYKGRLESTS